MGPYHLKTLKSKSNHSLRSQQRLLPLFALAFGLVGLGAYTSYQSFHEEHSTARAELIAAMPVLGEFLLENLPGELSTDDVPEGLDLQYRASRVPGTASSYTLRMRQQNEYGADDSDRRMMETSFEIGWLEQIIAEESSTNLVIDREFGAVRIDVVEQGTRVGADITHQLAELLSGTRGRVVMNDRGLIKSQQWESEANAQTLQTLHLLDDAVRLVSPHFLRQAVHVGEEWKYWLKTGPEDATQERLEAAGGLEVSNRVAGTIVKDGRVYAVIVQHITGSMQGVFDGITHYTMSGAGRGLVLFDVESGTLLSSQMELVRTTRLHAEGQLEELNDASEQTSRIALYLVRGADVLAETAVMD